MKGWLAPTTASGPINVLLGSYSPPPPARKPVRPLHASPGWDPSVRRTFRTSLGICPQLWTCAAVRPAGGSPSFCPEKAQIEFVCAGAAVGLPFPVTSPANAEPAPTAATATPQSTVATNDLKRISLPPHLGPVPAVSAGGNSSKHGISVRNARASRPARASARSAVFAAVLRPGRGNARGRPARARHGKGEPLPR